ncbi:MAG TPA: DUF222 domain-containing protein [Microbacterium sp.]|uniref:HNH endonuclease signature motif containing protein n=1 Tax=Microbacterium sp. TaxID=51671 RepID=UPI002BC7585D|nr:DUF222 domain-containing protein [Microbacterium sp.]HWI30568.1 DUF222 domain-containing protein [Microbacterium sp.]
MYEALPVEEHARFDPDVLIDERDVIDADVDVLAAGPWTPSAGESFDAGLWELEGAAARARVLIADQYRIMGEVLDAAASDPTPWVGPDPTLDPEWFDPRGRSVGAMRRARSEIAVRAAAADIAVRLRMAEGTVHTRAGNARTLKERCPRLWEGFLSGRVGEANAVAAAQLANSLPNDAAEAWHAFDEQLAAPAELLTAGKFRVRARVVRERVHAESIDERHRRAAKDRSVWVSAELDGMAMLNAFMPATDAHAAVAQVDAMARRLASNEDERRTMAQLRADVLADLLTQQVSTQWGDERDAGGGGDGVGNGRDARNADAGGIADGGGAGGAARTGAATREAATTRVGVSGRTGASIAITIPALTLLGRGDEPATLDGYGPIDLDTARRLAGGATSWIRVLTHPVTGTVLDVDRTTYRVPKALRRWLGVRHPLCVFPGCRRPSAECDIDHSLDWQYGGRTSGDNLAPVCGAHHTVKHESLWSMTRDPVTGEIAWTSPTGFTTSADPPPF